MKTTNPLEEQTNEAALERCRTYVTLQLQDRQTRPLAARRQPGPAVTLTHETGCGTHAIASHLAGRLQASDPQGPCAWTVFDRRLMERVLEEHNLPTELAKYIPEDRRSYLQDTTEELLGLRPPSWKIVPQTVETILHLVELGRVILVGRGAGVITAHSPKVFRVRLVAPLAERIRHVAETQRLSEAAAAEQVAKVDRGRARYVKQHFGRRIDDPLLYQAVINTGGLTAEDVAAWIADGARRWFQRVERNQHEA